MFKLRLFVAFGALTVLVLGCSKTGNPNAPGIVTGKVTYKGEPVTAGTVTFHTSSGPVGMTSINPDGTYGLAECHLGDFTITVDTESANPNKKQVEYKGGSGGPMAAMYPGKKSGNPSGSNKEAAKASAPPDYAKTGSSGTYVKIPAKYTNKATSKLTVTVAKGPNTKDLELTD